MRLVHLADLHLGFRQYQRLTPSGINQREADIAASVGRAIDAAIALRPAVVVVGGDVFHSVRPSNSAILHAYRMFSRLRTALPDAAIVMVAGNHDAPRTTDAGCILRLFREIGIAVADARAEVFTFPELSLSVMAVPDVPGIARPRFVPQPGFRHNVLLVHGEIPGVVPGHAANADRAAVEIPVSELNAELWSYIAFGHYHVYREIAPRAYYSGSIDYTSTNPWGELREEREARIPGKGFIEHDLVTHAHRFHPVAIARGLLDLHSIDASDLSAAELDQAIAARVNAVPQGIDDRIVRLMVRNVPRHIARELDQTMLREYKRRALHFQLDTRKPEAASPRVSGGAPGRRATLEELVVERLNARALPAGVERAQLVAKGLHYLAEAEESLGATLSVVEG
ncbi:MAG: DNA repair exonuclease [Phycisphaerae bacterium]|nr:DNA repair exonuclease [Gemmatimonadaceae bacterium]